MAFASIHDQKLHTMTPNQCSVSFASSERALVDETWKHWTLRIRCRIRCIHGSDQIYRKVYKFSFQVSYYQPILLKKINLGLMLLAAHQRRNSHGETWTNHRRHTALSHPPTNIANPCTSGVKVCCPVRRQTFHQSTNMQISGALGVVGYLHKGAFASVPLTV